MMQCVKTGCAVYISEYGCFANGDAFLSSAGLWVFRISAEAREPFGSRRHFTINQIEHWFDQHRQIGTLIAAPGGVEDHGYEGMAEPFAQQEEQTQ